MGRYRVVVVVILFCVAAQSRVVLSVYTVSSFHRYVYGTVNYVDEGSALHVRLLAHHGAFRFPVTVGSSA